MPNAVAPDLITVEITRSEEIAADHVILWVTIRGSSLFTGDSALKKAREVSQMVADLTARGLDESDIQLHGVTADVSSGLLGKSSSARYSLRIRCPNLDLLAEILGVITGQKAATLEGLCWGYGGREDLQERLLQECIRLAGQKAQRIAEGLGVRLAGVHSFTEGFPRPESGVQAADTGPGGDLDAMAWRREDMAWSVFHTTSVKVHVTVEYRVEPLSA